MIRHFYVSAILDAETNSIPSDAFDLWDNTKYGITGVTGLDRPDAEVTRSALAGANASRISGAQIPERNIVLNIRPWISPEINRQELYDHLPFNTDLRFYIVTDYRSVFIDGCVEKLGGGGFSKDVTDVQLSIICPFPWFQSVDLHKENLIIGDNLLLHRGDISAGFWLEVNNEDPEASNISDLSLSIGSKYFAYSGTIISPYICTIPGQKAFRGFGRDGTPAFGMMDINSDWITLNSGKNVLSVSTNSPSQFLSSNTLYYRDTYSGV